jgi:uncharacterized protein YndB with AHSA1/START domain
MMWSYEHAIEADIDAAAVWSAWADVASWNEWNADIERIAIDGPFAVGARIEMKPRGADPITLRLDDVRPGERFVDVVELEGVVVTTTHQVEETDSGSTRILYRTEITGPAAEQVGPHLGPAITEDFPQTMETLVERLR